MIFLATIVLKVKAILENTIQNTTLNPHKQNALQ